MSIRELTPELAQLAKDELGEVPSRIPADLQAIKDWLAKQTYINARTDDQWLIAFLRGCKYSLERTKEKLDNYYTMRTTIPELTEAVHPSDAKLQEIMKLGVNLILPKPCSPNGVRVIIIRPGAYDPNKFNVLDTMKLSNMATDLLLRDDDHIVVAGMRVIIDLKNVGIGHFTQMNPSNVKKMVASGQDALPIRQKGTHHINTPPGVESVFAIIKSFMNEKSKQRLFIHNEDMEALYKFVPKDILPEEYGGNGGKIQDIIDDWKKKIEDNADWFMEGVQFKTDESKRPGKPRTAETIFGIEGSFRQLNVD